MREQVLAWCRSEGLSAWDRRTHEGMLRNLVVREGRRTGQIQVRLVSSPGELRAEALAGAVDCDGLLWTQADALGETTARGDTRVLAGSGELEEEICDLRLVISPEAFFQTNTEMAERLYTIAAEYAGLRGWEKVFDLYCGIGTVGLTLASRAGELWGLEVVEAAVADAIENARRNDVEHAHFFAGDVRLALRELVERAGRPDVAGGGPAARRPVARRWCGASSRPRRGASSTSPAIRRRWRPTRPSSSRRGGRCGACGRRHVPADAAHRVRRAARARGLTAALRRGRRRGRSRRCRGHAGVEALQGRADRRVGLGVDRHPDVAGVDLHVLGRGVQAGTPVHDAVRARVDGHKADRAGNGRSTARRTSAQHSPSRQSRLNRPGAPRLPRAPTTCTWKRAKGWMANGSTSGEPIATTPETRSGRRAASERPSVPPWLWPMIATRWPVAAQGLRAMLERDRSAAVKQPR